MIDHYLLEFRVGCYADGGWYVGAFIDGVLSTARGPYEDKATAEAARAAWTSEVKAQAKDIEGSLLH
jgi:hypothetical protein